MMEAIEKEEFTDRMKALSEEEQQLALKMFPSDMMWDELKRRDSVNREMIINVKNALKIS